MRVGGQISGQFILLIPKRGQPGVFPDEVQGQLGIVLGAGVMQKIVISEVDAVFEESASAIFLNLIYNYIGLPRQEKRNDVVVDGVAYLLLGGVAHPAYLLL